MTENEIFSNYMEVDGLYSPLYTLSMTFMADSQESKGPLRRFVMKYIQLSAVTKWFGSAQSKPGKIPDWT